MFTAAIPEGNLRAEPKGQFLLGIVFAKGCEFLLVGGGLGSGSGGWWGGGLLAGNKGKEKGGEGGWGVGWGQAKEPASQCARVCPNYPSAKLPLSFSPKPPCCEHSPTKSMMPAFLVPAL